MTKSGFIFATIIFTVGVVLVVLNSTITGAVVGTSTQSYSFLIVLLGLLFIVTSVMLFIAVSYRHPSSIDEEESYRFSVSHDEFEEPDKQVIDSRSRHPEKETKHS